MLEGSCLKNTVVYDKPKKHNLYNKRFKNKNKFPTEYSVLVDLSTFSGTDEEVVASGGRTDAVDSDGRTDKEAATTSSFDDGSATASISIISIG